MKSKKSIMVATAVFCIVAATVLICGSADVRFEGTFWALVPPLTAIVLALITKEVYSSLFLGILLGAVMASKCSFFGTVNTLTGDGLIASVEAQAGILVFLVLLGIVVALINKSGASAAFGKWAQTHIKSRPGAMFATFVLGILIFIDDYFNCLTVGSVMSPVTDSKKISRVKLAYLIDATAAPVCMIAPVSSWAAAVAGCVESEKYSGFELFVKAIPYNFYSIFTFVFIIMIIVLGYDYGKMASFEKLAVETGDLSELDAETPHRTDELKPDKAAKGHVIDLIVPVLLIVGFSVWGLLYIGYQNSDEGANLQTAFSNTDATVGLPWGSIIALVLIILYMVIRKVVTFEEAMDCIPKGFNAMVPAITILILATSLKTMTNLLDSKGYVEALMANAEDLRWALPAIVFVIACVISFATGTSWGTFGILIPIVSVVFPEESSLFFVGISACLAGAVCGDHCSPISDTTIMSSAGAHCNHINHVETQLPYALTVAGISFVSYLVAGLLDSFGSGLVWISIPFGLALTIAVPLVLKMLTNKLKSTVTSA